MDKQSLACILAFCGESGSGKSTIAQIVCKCLQEQGFRAQFATKYISGRQKRVNEDPNVKIVDKVPETCMISSPRAGQEIGYDLQEIKQMIEKGIFPIIITKDVQFLARLSSLVNSENPTRTSQYKKKQLPIINMRIYDVQSPDIDEKELINIAKSRYPNMSQQQVLAEAKSRQNSWEDYYKHRYGFSDFAERIVNFKNFGVDFMKKEISNLIVGTKSNEDTILGYIGLWEEDEKIDNTGIILSKYYKIAAGAKKYLEAQKKIETMGVC